MKRNGNWKRPRPRDCATQHASSSTPSAAFLQALNEQRERERQRIERGETTAASAVDTVGTVAAVPPAGYVFDKRTNRIFRLNRSTLPHIADKLQDAAKLQHITRKIPSVPSLLREREISVLKGGSLWARDCIAAAIHRWSCVLNVAAVTDSAEHHHHPLSCAKLLVQGNRLLGVGTRGPVFGGLIKKDAVEVTNFPAPALLDSNVNAFAASHGKGCFELVAVGTLGDAGIPGRLIVADSSRLISSTAIKASVWTLCWDSSHRYLLSGQSCSVPSTLTEFSSERSGVVVKKLSSSSDVLSVCCAPCVMDQKDAFVVGLRNGNIKFWKEGSPVSLLKMSSSVVNVHAQRDVYLIIQTLDQLCCVDARATSRILWQVPLISRAVRTHASLDVYGDFVLTSGRNGVQCWDNTGSNVSTYSIEHMEYADARFMSNDADLGRSAELPAAVVACWDEVEGHRLHVLRKPTACLEPEDAGWGHVASG